MKIQITNIIGLNKLQYINLVDGQFNDWCQHISSVFYVPMRELQKNSSLYNWFLMQWDKRIVTPFLIENEPYIMAGVKDPETYYGLFCDKLNTPYSLKRIYPSVLIKNIKNEHYKSLTKK